MITVLLQGRRGCLVRAAAGSVRSRRCCRLNDVGRGDLLASDGQQPVFTKNIQNDAGTATVQLNRLPARRACRSTACW